MAVMLGIMADSYNASAGISPPTIVGTSFNSYNSGLTRNVTPHASTATGDLMIVVGADIGSTATMTAAPTWTTLRPNFVTNTLGSAVWAKIRQAGDTSYDFPISASAVNSTHGCITIRDWSGSIADLVVSSDGTRALSGATFTTTAPSLATLNANNLVLCLATERTTATETGISSVTNDFTERLWVGHQLGGIETVWIGSKIATTAGTVGTTSVTYPVTQNVNGFAMQIAIPAVTTGWRPTYLPAIFGWWDAADLISITDAGAGAVSSLGDKSGNGRHVNQTTAANRPVSGTHTIGGRNGLHFDPTVNAPHLTIGAQTLNQPYTWACVAQYDNADTTARNMMTGGTIFLRTNTGSWQINGGTGLIDGTDDANPHAFVGIFNGTSSSLRIDGVEVAAGTAGTGGISVAAFQLGRNTAATTWDGVIGEWIVTNAVVGGADLTSLESYLMDKWAI